MRERGLRAGVTRRERWCGARYRTPASFGRSDGGRAAGGWSRWRRTRGRGGRTRSRKDALEAAGACAKAVGPRREARAAKAAVLRKVRRVVGLTGSLLFVRKGTADSSCWQSGRGGCPCAWEVGTRRVSVAGGLAVVSAGVVAAEQFVGFGVDGDEFVVAPGAGGVLVGGHLAVGGVAHGFELAGRRRRGSCVSRSRRSGRYW